MAWIVKKRGTNEIDEISNEKIYELPSEFENSSNSTWHTATLTTRTYPRGNQRLHLSLSLSLSLSLYIYIYTHTHTLVCIYAGEIWNKVHISNFEN